MYREGEHAGVGNLTNKVTQHVNFWWLSVFRGLPCGWIMLVCYIFLFQLQKQWKNLITGDNCHPLKATILLWVQLPMWIFLSIALRNLVYMLPRNDGGKFLSQYFMLSFILQSSFTS